MSSTAEMMTALPSRSPAPAPVRCRARSLAPYRRIIPAGCYDEIQSLGRQLRGLRVAHVNATPEGGGVAEVLHGLVPLLRDAGIDANWYVMEPDEAFFGVTKHLHNLLQGAAGDLAPAERRRYLEHNARTAERLRRLHPDLWVIHDPQPAAAGTVLDGAPRVWRSHIDTSRPNPAAAEFLRPFVAPYDALIYSHPSYPLPGIAGERVRIIEPAIDPLAPKNRRPAPRRARAAIARIGIDPDRPLVAQVARLDPWKDPVGVIDAFRLARHEVPGLQLALLGVMAARDDPEAMGVYRVVQAHAGGDPDIHIYVDPDVIGPREVAAVQTAADVVLQKSLREGFGLSATEAMWKGTPLIVGNCGGLRVQVVDGESGYCVDSVAECAARLVELLHDRMKARRLARSARVRARERYLLPRVLRDHLRLYASLMSGRAATAPTRYVPAAD